MPNRRMGAGITKPQVISRQSLLRNTEGAQKLINDIFEVMRTKLTPEDFLKLGNPAQCKTFVFMMADSIQNMFTALRIRPRRAGDSGIVFFEEADALRIQNPETKQLCLIIAYFYIRIFQIFGALAITVLDDPSAGSVLAAAQIGGPGIGVAGPQASVGLFGRRLPGIQIGPGIPLGVRPPRPAGIPRAPMRGGGEEDIEIEEIYEQEGGADSGYFTGPAQQFYQLRELFDNPQFIAAGKKQLRMFPFRDNTNFVLIPGRQHESRNQNLKLSLDVDRAIYAQMTATKIGLLPDILHFKLSFTNFLYKDVAVADRLALSKINLQLRNYKEDLQIYSDDRGKSWRSDKQRISVVEELDQLSGRVQDIVRQLESNPELKIQDIAAVKKRAAAIGGPTIAAQRTYGVAGQPIVRGDAFVPKALQNEYIVATLKSIGTNRPVAFCVARALQLIDASSLFSNQIKTAVSGICFGSFQSRPASAPEVGKTLDKMTGMKILDQLYYTTPYIEQDKSQVGVDKEDAVAYSEFLKKMSGLFGRSLGQGGIEKIQVTENPGCVADAAKKYLNITDPKAIGAIVKIVGQLFNRQLAHTKRVLDFYRTRLFQIVRIKNPGGGTDLSYRLHPRLMAGGLAELSKLSKEARDILVEYYEGCEKTYQEGVKLVLQYRTR